MTGLCPSRPSSWLVEAYYGVSAAAGLWMSALPQREEIIDPTTEICGLAA